MGDGVLIKYDDLKAVDESLKQIIEELKEAENRQNDLEDSIGKPYGKDKLRDAAHEFEGGWDDRRNKLRGDIEEVEQHLAGVLKGFEDWDHDTTTEMSQAGG